MHIQSFIRGIAVGFILGVLYAPNRGEETRRKISEKASSIKDTVKDTYNAVSNTVSKVKSKANEILNKGQEKNDDISSMPNSSSITNPSGMV
ncbi:MAG TPA: YtxH domain-containing protein [Chitinophagaceae bacterium]|jgi:gas vesicle protein